MVEVENIAYCTDVGCNKIEEVLSLILKPEQRKTMTSTLFDITENRLMMCKSPFSPELEMEIVQNCTALRTDSSILVQRLAEERKVTILKKGNNTVMLNQAEHIAMAKSKVQTNIFIKKTNLRRIDRESLVKLLQNINATCKTVNSDSSAKYNTKVTGFSPREVQRDYLPIQATEMDTDMQLAINAPSLFSSPRETSVPSGFSYRSANARSSADLAAPTTRSGQTEDSNSFIRAIPRYPEYQMAEKRLMTFQTPVWQSSEKPDLAVFVDKGFFFTGREDLVRCYMCGIGLKDWVRNDAVLQEHVKHSPKCTYLLQKFGKSEVDRIQADISSGNLSSSSGSQLPYKIRSPQYQTMEARLATYKSFPSNIGIPHQQLAVAGLYFTGQGDLCRCFTCDGGLKDWSTGDDPCREHATYFPNCDYINQLKGRDYVKALQQTRHNNQSAGAAGGDPQPDTSTLLSMEKLCISSSNHMQNEEKSTPAAEDKDPKDLQAIAEENERLSQMVQCMLCVEEEPNMLFLPCAHHRICHKCSEKITHCPVCNNHIKEKVRTYLSLALLIEKRFQ